MNAYQALGIALILGGSLTTGAYVHAAGVLAQRATPAPPVSPATSAQPELRRQFLLRSPGVRLGVIAKDVQPAEAERLKVQSGVVIESVMPQSPAAAAGLLAGDIVVEFDGERVRSTRQFARLVQESIPNRQVQASVVRSGERRQIAVTPAEQNAGNFPFDSATMEQYLGNLADRWPFDGNPMRTPRSRLGATVEELTPQLAEYFGAKDGVLVTAVTENTPARKAGLRAGDVIVRLDGQPITSGTDLRKGLSTAATGSAIAVGIVRDHKTTTLTATLDDEAQRSRSGRRNRGAPWTQPI